MSQPVTLGRTLHFRLHETHAEAINRRRTSSGSIVERIGSDKWPLCAQAHIGNVVSAGDVFQVIVTRVWSEGCFNGQVLLDGSDSFWVTSVTEGENNGQWFWPPRVGGAQ